MENKPSVEGILKKHLDKSGGLTFVQFSNGMVNSLPAIIAAMQEYASLLVAAKEKEIEELEYRWDTVANGLNESHDTVEKLQKEIEGLKEEGNEYSRNLKNAIERCGKLTNDVYHYKALAESVRSENQYYLYGIEILKKLCSLKYYKDTVGKDAVYEREQPQTWSQANDFIKQIEGMEALKTQSPDRYDEYFRDHAGEADNLKKTI